MKTESFFFIQVVICKHSFMSQTGGGGGGSGGGGSGGGGRGWGYTFFDVAVTTIVGCVQQNV
jgi:hypothetical protein